MAKKGRDLFEILRERTGGGSRPRAVDARPRKPEARSGHRTRKGPDAGADLASVGRGITDWFKRKVGAEPPPPPEPRFGQTGIILAVVAIAALLLGFVVGRVSNGGGGEPNGRGDLRMGAGPDGGAPQPAAKSPDATPPERDAIGRDPARAEEQLSTEGFRLLYFPALDRQKAADVATWLRTQGFETAREKTLRDDGNGSHWVAVLCYTKSPAQSADIQARLRNLVGPAFAPELTEAAHKAAEAGVVDCTFLH